MAFAMTTVRAPFATNSRVAAPARLHSIRPAPLVARRSLIVRMVRHLHLCAIRRFICTQNSVDLLVLLCMSSPLSFVIRDLSV